MSDRPTTPLRRRRASISGALATALTLAVALASATAALANPTTAENALPGDSSWQYAVDHPAGSVIAGYPSAPSVAPGGSLPFHVNAAAPYRVVVYRMGWYGGDGARRMTCLPSCTAASPRAVQRAAPPPSPTTGEVDAGWSVTNTLQTSSSWVSGYYVAEFVVASGNYSGQGSWYPFIVLPNAAQQHSGVLVDAPVNTWQAYNNWGGKSLYASKSTNNQAATSVSFNRPMSYENAPLFGWEYQLVRFLEREGYDVSYTTDVDLDANPSQLLDHALDVSAGHAEYWSKGERDGWEAARDGGHNLAFLGADTSDWQIRYAASRRTIVEYRSATADPEPDPALKTTEFRELNPPRPQCELLGVQNEPGSILNGRSGSYRVDSAAAADSWISATGLLAGSQISSIVGYEFDGVVSGCKVPPLTSFMTDYVTTNGRTHVANAVRYQAPSGARVFSSGSLQFTWALDAFRSPALHMSAPIDTRLQAFMLNVFDALAPGSRPPPSGRQTQPGGTSAPAAGPPAASVVGSGTQHATPPRRGVVTLRGLTVVCAATSPGPCTATARGFAARRRGHALVVPRAARRHPVARASFVVPAGQSRVVKLKLTRRERRTLRRRRRIWIVVEISVRDGAGKTVVSTVDVLLKAAARR